MALCIETAWRGGCENRAGWWITFQAGETFLDGIDQLKAAVPPSERAYDEDTQRWWIAERWAPAVLRLAPALAAYLQQPALF